MKYSVLFVNAFFAVALAQKGGHQQHYQQQQSQQQQNQPQVDSKYKNIPIVAYENALEHDGSFSYSFEGGDGSRASQNGQLKYIDQQNAGEAVQGGYSFPGDDGKTYSLSYTADERGYQPVGDHLPTPPPVPEAIARAVEYLKSLPPYVDPIQTKKKN